MRGQQVNESFVVPPSTKSVLLFMRQAFQHICADRAELSLAGGGVNIKGTKHTWTPTTSSNNPATGGTFTDPEIVIEKRKQGKFLYDNQKLLIDPSVDPRLKRPISGDSTDKVSLGDVGADKGLMPAHRRVERTSGEGWGVRGRKGDSEVKLGFLVSQVRIVVLLQSHQKGEVVLAYTLPFHDSVKHTF